LDRGKQQTDQDTDDGDDYQQFDQRKRPSFSVPTQHDDLDK
jgi:hypothetical protein